MSTCGGVHVACKVWYAGGHRMCFPSLKHGLFPRTHMHMPRLKMSAWLL